MGHEAPRLPVGRQVVLRAAGAGADGRTVQRGATGRVATVYVLSQFKKLETDLRRDGTPKWKHVMHLLRLLLAARTLLRDGVVQVDVGPDRDRLLAVRRGERPWAEVESWRIGLHAELDRALDTTPLPPAPDVDRVDAWLRSVRARSLTPPLGTPLDHVRP